MKQKLTTIICATSIQQAYEVCKSVEATSGVECEFFIHDNNFFKWSLAKTYNTYAKLATSNNILLCHQDVHFIGSNWGKTIARKLAKANTGVIGYAGTVIKLKDCYSGWALNVELSRNNYSYKSESNRIYMCKSKPFDEVVAIDGLAMFVSKKHLLEHPFDEELLTGFHCYDIDFSMQLFLSGLKNYVFTDEECSVIHDSPGNYDERWAIETKKLTDLKWSKFLPLQTEDVEQKMIDELTMKKNEEFQKIMNGKNKSEKCKKIIQNDYKVRFNECSIYSTWV